MVTFVFRSSPHASSSGREGIDALLAASAYTEELTVIFIGDGVAQLVEDQETSSILSKAYTPMFRLLELYEVETIYVCRDSLNKMGLVPANLVLEPTCLSQSDIAAVLNQSDKVLTF